MFKSQLQEYAQKARLPAPVYNSMMHGPSNNPQFQASVTIQGETYVSPTLFTNLKAAEHAAAKVALTALAAKSGSNAASLDTLHESGLCKSMLQQYAQKYKLALPEYTLTTLGEIPNQSFCATVDIAGFRYAGGFYKTRKGAEALAARAALLAIYSAPVSFSDFQHHQPSIIQQNTSAVFAGPSLIHGIKRKEVSDGLDANIKENKKVLSDGLLDSTNVNVDGLSNGGCSVANGQKDIAYSSNGSSLMSLGNIEIPGVPPADPQMADSKLPEQVLHAESNSNSEFVQSAETPVT